MENDEILKKFHTLSNVFKWNFIENRFSNKINSHFNGIKPV